MIFRITKGCQVFAVLFGFVLSIQAQECGEMDLIFSQDFNQHPDTVQYTIDLANQDFAGVASMTAGEIRGLDGNGKEWPHKTRIENGTLTAEYLPNIASGRFGGFLFDKLFSGQEEAIMEYRLKFDKDFIWAYGGKLPGLGGTTLTGNGSIPAGCTQVENKIKNGFSARLMWRQSGAGRPVRLVVYTYFPDRTTNCGTDIEIIRGLELDKWYTIRQHIKLNTPGERDGIIRMYIDSVLQLEKKDVLFREAGKENVKINSAIFQTYRGGGADDTRWWSPTLDNIYFDDFKVWGCNNVSTTTESISDFENRIEIFPNPTEEDIYITKQDDQRVDASLFNLKGQLILKQSIFGRYGAIARPDNLPAGIYFLRLTSSDQHSVVRKVVFR